jgi:hypothetical protein
LVGLNYGLQLTEKLNRESHHSTVKIHNIKTNGNECFKEKILPVLLLPLPLLATT